MNDVSNIFCPLSNIEYTVDWIVLRLYNCILSAYRLETLWFSFFVKSVAVFFSTAMKISVTQKRRVSSYTITSRIWWFFKISMRFPYAASHAINVFGADDKLLFVLRWRNVVLYFSLSLSLKDFTRLWLLWDSIKDKTQTLRKPSKERNERVEKYRFYNNTPRRRCYEI